MTWLPNPETVQGQRALRAGIAVWQERARAADRRFDRSRSADCRHRAAVLKAVLHWGTCPECGAPDPTGRRTVTDRGVTIGRCCDSCSADLDDLAAA